ncbi:MAG TPA: DUF1592 domain-containing protein [Polyangiaceae bacterium]|nr:DUF1592 domain-containing protein [Polyangiaceae bacterium]
MRHALVAALIVGILVGCRPRAADAPAPVALPADAQLIPARLRRLSNAEYERAASELLGETLEVQRRLPPDVRQEGYTLNATQPVPAAHATRLTVLAQDLADSSVARNLSRLVPCSAQPSESCVDQFVRDFARRAFRRPPTEAEVHGLGAVFERGQKDGGGFAGGARLVLSTLLQAPSFMYIRELGEPAAGGRRALTSLEMGASLAFLVSGGPPDAELLELGEQGRLVDPAVRAEQARRLLAKSDTRHHFRQFVLEWLEVDQLAELGKDADLAPSFERLKPRMLDETRAFVDEVMVHEGASIRALLSAGFASVDAPMARYYGFDAYGPRVSLKSSARLGLLQQASFLAAHAHEDITSPVKRGDFVMRKLLCTTLPRPQELNIEVTIPAPTPTQTTRERFTEHVTNTSCRACHEQIDPLGYTFENFDAAGRERKRQNGKDIVTRAAVNLDGKRHDFEDSTDLSRWLAQNETTHACFARHAFRYFSAQSDPEVERSFTRMTDRLEPSRRENLIELVVTYVQSDLFALRGAVE